jgi:hypothetical protein
MIKTVLSSLLLITCFAFPVRITQANPPPSGPGKLVGQVIDETSAPIGRAFLLVYWEEGREKKIINVDEKGAFELELAPGFYDVLAGSTDFAPSCRRIEIVRGATSRFDPKLKPDFEHLEEQSGGEKPRGRGEVR